MKWTDRVDIFFAACGRQDRISWSQHFVIARWLFWHFHSIRQFSSLWIVTIAEVFHVAGFFSGEILVRWRDPPTQLCLMIIWTNYFDSKMYFMFDPSPPLMEFIEWEGWDRIECGAQFKHIISISCDTLDLLDNPIKSSRVNVEDLFIHNNYRYCLVSTPIRSHSPRCSWNPTLLNLSTKLCEALSKENIQFRSGA